jgi:hypothetical protein
MITETEGKVKYFTTNPDVDLPDCGRSLESLEAGSASSLLEASGQPVRPETVA